MTTLLTEWQASDPIDISDGLRAVLESTFEARVVTAGGGKVRAIPGGVVGSVQVGAERIVVTPKIGIDRVLFMVAHAADPYRWSPTASTINQVEDLVEGMGALLVQACEGLIAQGLLRSYRRVDRDAPYVKGRIRWERQARRFAPIPLAIRHDVHDDDIIENQVLRAAAQTIIRAGLGLEMARRVGRLWRVVEHVSPIRDPIDALDRVKWTRHNEHYRPILELARVILTGSMADLGDGDVPVRGFTLVLHDVFERFVRRALRAAAGVTIADFPESWAGGGLSLAQSGAIRLKPDLGVRVANSWRFVGDVKYKIDSGGGKDSDLYQALVYAVATGLPEATLIYAQGPAVAASHVVRHLGVTLHVRHLDLAREPGAVLDEIRNLAAAIRPAD